jgi:hypothetical protein
MPNSTHASPFGILYSYIFANNRYFSENAVLFLVRLAEKTKLLCEDFMDNLQFLVHVF